LFKWLNSSDSQYGKNRGGHGTTNATGREKGASIG